MPKVNLPVDMPEGFQFVEDIIFGKRKSHPGLFEIKLHNPKHKNGLKVPMYHKVTQLIKQAEQDDEVKCILFHGGSFFSSGNDLSAFFKTKFNTIEEAHEKVRDANRNGWLPMTMAFAEAKKPIICLVRGGCMGIAFTTLGNATMIYCSPDAFFRTPFMDSS